MFSQGKPTNSKKKFVDELKETRIVKHSFETADKLNTPSSGKLKQTKLVFAPSKKIKINLSAPKNEFILLPAPRNQSSLAITTSNKIATTLTNTSIKKDQNTSLLLQINKDLKTPMTKTGRDLLSLVGRVDFCLKTHKLHSNVNAIWDIYGQLLKILTGKHRFEHILILRNQNKGPILQSIYYDFDGILKQFQIGCYLRVVGQFVGDNRLRTFKVNDVSPATWQQNFTRVQNVTSFILLQNSLPK